MERRTIAALGTAAGAAALLAGTGAVLALKSDPAPAPTVQLESVVSTDTTDAPTTTAIEAPTSTVEVTVTTVAPVTAGPSTTQYVAPPTTRAGYASAPVVQDTPGVAPQQPSGLNPPVTEGPGGTAPPR